MKFTTAAVVVALYGSADVRASSTSSLRGGRALTSSAASSVIKSTIEPIIDGNGLPRELACEFEWGEGLIGNYYSNNNVTPRRLYQDTCATDTSDPSMYTSYTVAANGGQGEYDTQGAISKTTLDANSGKLVVRASKIYPECVSMHGIAVSSSCGRVAALCRMSAAESANRSADYDPIAQRVKSMSGQSPFLSSPDACSPAEQDQMWLYEWENGDIESTPTTAIVHKNIARIWEHGEHYLRYGEDDNTSGTYAIAVKASSSGCHQGDSFLILDREKWTFENNRGWTWACATGHTMHNRPAYDDINKRYGMLCSTDASDYSLGAMAEIAFTNEEHQKDVVALIQKHDIGQKGGAGPLVGKLGGGFLGLIVAEETVTIQPMKYGMESPTQIELVEYDTQGSSVGGIKWIVHDDPGAYFSAPQLAHLGNDRYLVGYGRFYEIGSYENDPTNISRSVKVPSKFFVMEIDGNGNRLTDPIDVTGVAGFGEVNEMVSMGNGRVAWSYVSADQAYTTDIENSLPSCHQPNLAHYIYTSSDNNNLSSTIPPLPSGQTLVDLDWSGFSAATVQVGTVAVAGNIVARFNAGTSTSFVSPETGDTWQRDPLYLGMGTKYSRCSHSIYCTTRYFPLSPTRLQTVYEVDVPSGEYLVKLHFSENYFKAGDDGKRVFGITVEDSTILDNFDIIAESQTDGDIFGATVKPFVIVEYVASVSDGKLSIGFIPRVNSPMIAGIEIFDAEYEYPDGESCSRNNQCFSNKCKCGTCGSNHRCEGEYCSTSSECGNGVECRGDVCGGRGLYNHCSSSLECEIGLDCRGNVCGGSKGLPGYHGHYALNAPGSHFNKKLVNSLDDTLCLTYGHDDGRLSLKNCVQDDFAGYTQAFDIINSGQPGKEYSIHLSAPDGAGTLQEFCLKPRGKKWVKYDFLVFDEARPCASFRFENNGKISTKYGDSARVHIGVSGSCHTEEVEGRRVELQGFDFSTSRSCGLAQVWDIRGAWYGS